MPPWGSNRNPVPGSMKVIGHTSGSARWRRWVPMALGAGPTIRHPKGLAVLMLSFAAAVAILAATMLTSGAVPADPGDPALLASTTPSADTPRILDGEVWDIARAGNTVFLAGNFTQIDGSDGTTTISRPYLAAYDITTGALRTDVAPALDGPVRALAVSSDGSTLYLGGDFTTAGGLPRAHLAAMDVSTGTVVGSFRIDSDQRVTALAVGGNRLYVGGRFYSIGGYDRTRLAAVNLDTQSIDTSFDLPVDEPTGASGGSSVKHLEVSPDGTTLLSVHNDRLVDGQVRAGVALIDISGPVATLRPWYTDLYDLNRCGVWDDTRVRSAAISPDGSYFVVVSSGDDHPPACDTAVAFPMEGEGRVEPLWISRHFDTIESVAITWNAVYVGGHFYFQEAPGATEPWPGEDDVTYGGGGASVLEPEVTYRRRMGALNPADGTALDWQPQSNGARGVLVLRATPGWLLMGHDGDQIGGSIRGRHGSFALPDAPAGASPVLPLLLTTAPSTTTSTTTTTAPSTTTTSSTTTTTAPSTTTTSSTTTTTAPSTTTTSSTTTTTVPAAEVGGEADQSPGYWMLEGNGEIHSFGAAPSFPPVDGSAIDMDTDPTGTGVWILDSSGRVQVRGSARWYGDADLESLEPGEVVSAISVRPEGDGYWVFTDRGRAMAFGSATGHGDLLGIALDGRVIASVATVTGEGYWMVGADGGVFAFGDAEFHGSTGGMTLDRPVVGLAPDPDGEGYWLVAADGGVFAFDAPFRGSLPAVLAGLDLNRPIVALVAYGDGYVMLGSDGGAFSFSDKPFLGSLGDDPPDSDVVAIAAF